MSDEIENKQLFRVTVGTQSNHDFLVFANNKDEIQKEGIPFNSAKLGSYPTLKFVIENIKTVDKADYYPPEDKAGDFEKRLSVVKHVLRTTAHILITPSEEGGDDDIALCMDGAFDSVGYRIGKDELVAFYKELSETLKKHRYI